MDGFAGTLFGIVLANSTCGATLAGMIVSTWCRGAPCSIITFVLVADYAGISTRLLAIFTCAAIVSGKVTGE